MESENLSAPAPKPVKKKIPALDLMKFMGILIVVFYHCRSCIPVNIVTDRSLDQYFFYGVLTLIGPCVPFFFLVNGYLLFDHSLDLKKHIKKTVHFFVLGLVWSFITLACSMLASPDYEFSVKYLIEHGILMDTTWFFHLWFMGAMVILYTFFPIMKAAWDHNRGALYFFLGVCFVMVFGSKLLNMGVNVYTWLRYGVNGDADYKFFSVFDPFFGFEGYIFIYFCLGAIIREYQDKFLEIMKPWVCIVGIIVTTALLYLYGYFMSLSTGTIWLSGDPHGNDVIISLIRVLCIFGLSFCYKGTGRSAKFINYISSNTMGVYLIHYVLRNVTMLWVQTIPIPGYFLKTLIYSAVIFALSVGIMEVMKRIPVLKKLIA